MTLRKARWMMLFVNLMYLYSRIKVFLGIIKTKYGIMGYYLYKGIPHSRIMHEEKRLEAVRAYDNFRDDDVVLLTYPKAGTNFTVGVISAIFKAKGLDPSPCPFENSMRTLMVNNKKTSAKPTGSIMDDLDCSSGPRIIGTHCLWSMLPPKVQEGKVKVIHCGRNPKDVVCSMFPFIKKMGVLLPGTAWKDFVFWFIEGNLIGGGYFDFIKEWYPHRNLPNFLQVQFEDMKKDLEGNVRRIARFLEVELTQEQVNEVVFANTFENKKKEMGSSHPIYRKGKSGGWKSELTVEQNEMMNEWIQQEMEELKELEISYS